MGQQYGLVLPGKLTHGLYAFYVCLYSCELAKQITLKRTIGIEAMLTMLEALDSILITKES